MGVSAISVYCSASQGTETLDPTKNVRVQMMALEVQMEALEV